MRRKPRALETIVARDLEPMGSIFTERQARPLTESTSTCGSLLESSRSNARGLSQREKAAALGVSQPTILRDLKGDTNVSETPVDAEEGLIKIDTNVSETPEPKAHVSNNSGEQDLDPEQQREVWKEAVREGSPSN